MKGTLLVCIAFHYNQDRLKYLGKLVQAFVNEYDCPVHIIIDTNADFLPAGDSDLNDNIEIIYHNNLAHPFHLTWQHRKHFKANIEKYDYFMYVEDDMYLPYKNFVQYCENFKLLFPRFIPSFVRLENNEGKTYLTDQTSAQKPIAIIELGGNLFTQLKQPYHAFWIMPKNELRMTITETFDNVSDSRENAASYPMWGLQKPPLVEVFKDENGKLKLSSSSYSFHLPCNYATCKESPHGKILVENLFI